MLEKLQQLIMLRDEKRSRLKTQKKARKSSKIVGDSEEEDCSQSDE